MNAQLTPEQMERLRIELLRCGEQWKASDDHSLRLAGKQLLDELARWGLP